MGYIQTLLSVRPSLTSLIRSLPSNHIVFSFSLFWFFLCSGSLLALVDNGRTEQNESLIDLIGKRQDRKYYRIIQVDRVACHDLFDSSIFSLVCYFNYCISPLSLHTMRFAQSTSKLGKKPLVERNFKKRRSPFPSFF